MSLKDTVTEIVEDFNKKKNKSEVWETLEKKLKKAGFDHHYNEMIHETDISGAYEFLKVWDAIDEHLNKKKIHKWRYKDESFEVIKAISKINDIEDVIKILGESGYELSSFSDIFTYAYLRENNLKIFETLAKEGLYKKYSLVFKALNTLGYKSINVYKNMRAQLDNLISLARLEGNVSGAVYVLANNGYKIDDAEGLTKSDIRNIKKITEEDEKERAEGKGGIPIYLYDSSNLELFQGYFNSLKIEDKKSVLKSILEYETRQELQEPNKIRDWLEKNYESLLREVGFE